MAMSGQKQRLIDISEETDNKDLKDISEKWQYSINKLENTFEALNFRTSDTLSLRQIFDTVKILTFAKSSYTLDILNIDDSITVKSGAKYVIYILTEIVLYLYDNSMRDVKIVLKQADTATEILVNAKYDYEKDFLHKLDKIIANQKNVSIKIDNNYVSIELK